MPLRSLPQGGSCPDSDACPTSCRPRGAVLLPPASAPTCHRETHPQHAFFVALHVATVPADCWCANSASAPAETHSSTTSLQSLCAHARPRRPTSYPSTWRPPVLLSAGPPHDLPARGSLSASPPLLSSCWSVLPSTRCDKNAPHTAATALPDKTPRGSPPPPDTCPRQIAARPLARALSNAAETPSNWPCLLSTL